MNAAKKFAIGSFIGSLILLGLAVLFYRGGNLSNATAHFQWTTNFLSDLGLARVHTSTQPYVRAAFAGSLFLLAVTVISLVERWGLLMESSTERFASRLLAALVGLEVMTVAVVPADVNLTLHRAALVFTIIFTASLWTWLLRIKRIQERPVRWFTILTTVALWAYLIFLIVAPRPEASLMASQLQAQVEKSVFLLFLVNLAALLVE